MWLIVLAGESGRKREGKHVMFEVNTTVINDIKNRLLWIQQDTSSIGGVANTLRCRRCSSCVCVAVCVKLPSVLMSLKLKLIACF